MYLLGVALGPSLFGLLFIIDYKQIISYNPVIPIEAIKKAVISESRHLSRRLHFVVRLYLSHFNALRGFSSLHAMQVIYQLSHGHVCEF